MVKIALDSGHGINTKGKRSPVGEREWLFNNKVVRSIIESLKDYDNVKIVRLDDSTGRRDVPPIERTNLANQFKADILISIHHNAHKGKWGNHTGVETYHYPNSKEGKKLAEYIHPYVVKSYGLRDRGVKNNNFHMLRESKMPAILIEGGFMDSVIDIEKLRDDKVLESVGKSVASGIVNYFNLKKVSKPINKNQYIVKKGDTLYSIAKKHGTSVKQLALINGISDVDLIKVGQPILLNKSDNKKGDMKTNSIVDYLKSIGKDSSMPYRKKLAEQYGIKNYKGTEKQNIELLKKLRA